ncbi:MAG: PTS lactose/cellobiose transporter subunit IIA [Bacilli bacterium]|nr:PTS lactose/cellobiose transporter subunit IIA [Bacilli bacterium]
MNNEHTSFELITSAGNSKSYSMLAIEAAREKEFHKANEYIKKASDELKKAHSIQFELIQHEARGDHVDIDVILIHAQDHLTMALMMKDQAEEFIHIYKEFQEIKEGISE